MHIETTLHIGYLSASYETVIRDAVDMWMETHPEAPALNSGATLSEWWAWNKMESYQNGNLIQTDGDEGWEMFFHELGDIVPLCDALKVWITRPRDACNCAGLFSKDVLLECAVELYGYLSKAVSGWCEHNDWVPLYRDDGEEL